MLVYNVPKRKELKKNKKKKLPYLLQIQVQFAQADFQEVIIYLIIDQLKIIKYFKKNSVRIFFFKKKEISDLPI
jgi:hypothetical protein